LCRRATGRPPGVEFAALEEKRADETAASQTEALFTCPFPKRLGRRAKLRRTKIARREIRDA
jgi:hypothetical protein